MNRVFRFIGKNKIATAVVLLNIFSWGVLALGHSLSVPTPTSSKPTKVVMRPVDPDKPTGVEMWGAYENFSKIVREADPTGNFISEVKRDRGCKLILTVGPGWVSSGEYARTEMANSLDQRWKDIGPCTTKYLGKPELTFISATGRRLAYSTRRDVILINGGLGD